LRRQLTTEQKVALLQRHLVDKEPAPSRRFCDENQLQSSVFYPWMRPPIQESLSATQAAAPASMFYQ
jgi:hypothetical protein